MKDQGIFSLRNLVKYVPFPLREKYFKKFLRDVTQNFRKWTEFEKPNHVPPSNNPNLSESEKKEFCSATGPNLDDDQVCPRCGEKPGQEELEHYNFDNPSKVCGHCNWLEDGDNLNTTVIETSKKSVSKKSLPKSTTKSPKKSPAPDLPSIRSLPIFSSRVTDTFWGSTPYSPSSSSKTQRPSLSESKSPKSQSFSKSQSLSKTSGRSLSRLRSPSRGIKRKHSEPGWSDMSLNFLSEPSVVEVLSEEVSQPSSVELYPPFSPSRHPSKKSRREIKSPLDD